MKRYLPVGLLMLFLITAAVFCTVLSAYALGTGQVYWEWRYLADGTAEEKVTINDVFWEGEYEGWYFESADQINLSRAFAGLDAYNKDLGRLPVKVRINNYLVLKKISIEADNFTPEENSLISRLDKEYPVFISFEVSGSFFRSQKGLGYENWRPYQDLIFLDKETHYVFDGLKLGIFIFLAGTAVTLAIFFIKVKKVNSFIEKEYEVK
ncbi:MAG: hypothetical protein LBR98_02790 [Syntrophomonadaceae bacterium]|nr:hypothetical protein [Syntrophomonadaceae bacterium]